MTDLATKSGAEDAQADDSAVIDDAALTDADTDEVEADAADLAEADSDAESVTETEADADETGDLADVEEPAADERLVATTDVAPEADAPTEVVSPVADDAPATSAPAGAGPATPAYAWAPAEPAPRKSRKPLWIGLGAGAAVVAFAVASVTLIAPGTSVAGVQIGLLPSALAADMVNQRLADTTIVLVGEGGEAEVTGADLGASVDASSLVAEAFAANPLWNVTAWFPESIDAPVRIDDETATSALRAAAPELYTEPVDATLAYDATSVAYVTTPAEPGTGVDIAALRATLQDAFEAGETRVEFEAVSAPVQATTPTYVAEGAAARLNGILSTAGFYVGSERTVPVAREVAASWLTVTPGERGTFEISADAAAIEEIVAGLPAQVDRAAVDATVITNSAGDVLRELSEGVTGRTLGDTSSIADDFAAQLASGSGAYELPVTETEFKTTSLERRVEVDLSAQTTYLYENDKIIGTYTISSGMNATPTPTGHFTVNAYTRIQDMGALCYNPEAVNSYCTEDVPWITWFAPDIAFHGASAFRSALGFQQSHGCVNMWDADAKFIYDWTVTGTEVWVHA
ncbi:L,D-transpeptidase family protein [Microbacterium sp. NPDC056003]|uniref:L,D-transpeptidase family protein n=1 Tax=Microbacterium sp. NPDC056003 TaxID=3345676 RepID=UPI0035DCE975